MIGRGQPIDSDVFMDEVRPSVASDLSAGEELVVAIRAEAGRMGVYTVLLALAGALLGWPYGPGAGLIGVVLGFVAGLAAAAWATPHPIRVPPFTQSVLSLTDRRLLVHRRSWGGAMGGLVAEFPLALIERLEVRTKVVLRYRPIRLTTTDHLVYEWDGYRWTPPERLVDAFRSRRET